MGIAMDEEHQLLVQHLLLRHPHQSLLPAQVVDQHQLLVDGCGLKHLKNGNGQIPRLQQLRECHLTWLHHHHLLNLMNQTQIILIIIMTKDLQTLDG